MVFSGVHQWTKTTKRGEDFIKMKSLYDQVCLLIVMFVVLVW